jgi:Mg2+ and Co2+ transporter CorA
MTREEVMNCIRKTARENYAQEGYIEIDDGAMVSLAKTVGGHACIRDDGLYVQAWVWLNLSDLPLMDMEDLRKVFSVHRSLKEKESDQNQSIPE